MSSHLIIESATPTAYINRVGARIYTPYGLINGLAFEFSDGTKQYMVREQNDGNTDPYTADMGALRSFWVDLPNGFDELRYIAMNSSCNKQLMALIFYKNNQLIGSLDGRPFYGLGPDWEGNARDTLKVGSGSVVSKVIAASIDRCYPNAITPLLLDGIRLPQLAPIDGRWSDWLPWSDCSENCGPGVKSRSRTCIPPSNGGTPCAGESTETLSCNLKPCILDINGGWSEWSKYSECIGDCTTAIGTYIKKRVCNNPTPSGNGLPCDGPSELSESCPLTNCPVVMSVPTDIPATIPVNEIDKQPIHATADADPPIPVETTDKTDSFLFTNNSILFFILIILIVSYYVYSTNTIYPVNNTVINKIV